MNNSQKVLVSVENIAPENGTALTPLWVGFHSGAFDTIDQGRPASEGVERIAEDGNAEPLNQEFLQSGLGSTQAVVAGPNGPILPGDTGELLIDVADPASGGRYLNYAAMVLPSNDFFVANDDQREHLVFDQRGRFIGADFIITGDEVLDAGTEVNDEIPENTAFFGQSSPNTGVDENGVISQADGFIPDGNILSTPAFSNADFTQPGYQLARVRVFNAVVGDGSSEVLVGTGKDDYIEGNGGGDTLIGRNGNDRLSGGGGQDVVIGGNGNDELSGGGGRDKLLGGNGDDSLYGGNGRDTLLGGAGNDTLSGGGGRNVLIDNQGDNTFVLSDNGFADIRGFDAGDRISLGTTSLQFADLEITQSRRNTLIAANGQQLALLRRVDATTLTESVFA